MTIKKNWVTMGNGLEKLGDDAVTIEKTILSTLSRWSKTFPLVMTHRTPLDKHLGRGERQP